MIECFFLSLCPRGLTVLKRHMDNALTGKKKKKACAHNCTFLLGYQNISVMNEGKFDGTFILGGSVSQVVF